MIWLLTMLTFIATAGVVVALVYAFSPGEVSIATRLARLAGIAGPAQGEAKFADRQKERVRALPRSPKVTAGDAVFDHARKVARSDQ